jgi:hypothetical protein
MSTVKGDYPIQRINRDYPIKRINREYRNQRILELSAEGYDPRFIAEACGCSLWVAQTIIADSKRCGICGSRGAEEFRGNLYCDPCFEAFNRPYWEALDAVQLEAMRTEERRVDGFTVAEGHGMSWPTADGGDETKESKR